MNSRNQTETEKNQDENPTTQNYIKSKYESLNSFLDDEDSKYISNKENTGTENSNYYSDISKKDILSNINKLIEENDKKDQNFIYKKI